MRAIILTGCMVLLAVLVSAQQKYDAGLISKDLLPYASAVVRNEEITIEVKDLDNTIYHVKKAITVLNKNGDDIANIVVWHNKSNMIRNIKGLFFDEFGNTLGKFSESDFEDENASNDFSLFEDSRTKNYVPSVTTYPYTIEYEYEVRSKQSLIFNDWQPIPQTGVAVETSSYTFICKPNFNIRYKEINVPSKVSIGTNKDGLKTYTWHIQNVKAIKYEPYSPEPEKYLTSVKIASQVFNYAGIAGSYNNWQQLGKWEYDKLLLGRTDLPAETVEHIKQLTAGITDPKLKAKKIYEYMQQKTHYIGVQIGIGGFQPMLASDVDRLSYGDCKALVNYTQALLKVAGINSLYCVVEAGRAHKVSMLYDFASMDQGDHIILCVPFKNDTTWLECTNQQMPFGFLSDFTDDRTVLACTPEGGKLLHTPKYTYDENLEKHKADFVINEAGELSGSMESTFKGTDYDDREWAIEEAPVERVKDIKKEYPINNLEVDKLDYKQDKSLQPVTTEKIKLSARDYASVDNDKLNFMLNSINRKGLPPKQLRNRINEVGINRGYTEDDEITYTLPKGYSLENEPLQLNINKPFGNYTATTTLNGDKLVYKRKLQLKDGIYSKDTYQDLVDFFQSVYEADNYSILFVKKTNQK